MVDVEYIRKLYHVKGWTKSRIAETLGHSRNTVSKYLRQDDLPPRYHLNSPRPAPVLDPVKPIIDEWLAQDEKAPPKQRHTAKRIYDRLCEEYGFQGGESTVRRYVREVRATKPEAFLPLEYELGSTAQCDWGEVLVETTEGMQPGCLFCMRLCASGIPFVMVLPHAKTEALFEGHRRAFEFFGGVPHEIWYDNLKTAVAKLGPGKERVFQPGFVALKAHYLFEAEFCQPGRKGAHEKGLIENLVGYARRNFLVPVPKVSSLEELNAMLLEKCLAERDRRLGSREQSCGELWEKEKQRLIPLPDTPFACCRTTLAKVNSLGMVQFERCRYSVPVELVGRTRRRTLPAVWAW